MAAIDTAARVHARADTREPASNEGRAAYLAIAAICAYHAAALALVAAGLALSVAALVDHPSSLHPVELLPAALAAFVLLTLRQPSTGFSPPGPRLMRGADDGVFKVVDEIAAATGRLPFHELYLGAGADASVHPRDGRFGRGGRRRTLVIGFGLARVLTREELRALIVQLHARYHGGSRFGAYVERRRLAMRRGLAELDGRPSAITAMPYIAYSKFFLLTTGVISRRQVLLADAEAARLAGPDATSGALRALVGTPAVLDAYVEAWVTGNRRPFADYLRKYESRDRMAMAVHYRTRVQSGIEVPLLDRLARLDKLEPRVGIHDEPAAPLFCGLDDREHTLTVELATKRALT